MLKVMYKFMFLVFAVLGIVQAQSGGTITIAPNFLPDPTSIEYISGGNQSAAARFGEACQGFIEDEPDHILNLQDDFDYLHVKVESDEDTMLVIWDSSSQQVWCDDDSAGNRNPRIARNNWAAGSYQIFVGSYTRGTFADYRLSVSEYQRDFEDFNLDENNPYYIQLRPNFAPDPIVRNYSAGGERNATEIFGADCVGYIAEEPDFVLEILEVMPYLHLYVESDADTTMVLHPRGNTRALCSDDSIGLNPEFIASFPVGIFDIYIGLHTPNQEASYQFFLTERAVLRD